MNRGDVLWITILTGISLFLMIPASHEAFLMATRSWPFLMGFIKVAILATMGEWLARRIVTQSWEAPVGLPWRIMVWGFLGMSFVLVFDLFASGTSSAIQKGLLPAASEGFAARLSLAAWTSILMNLIFGPTFMALHRLTDTVIEMGEGHLAQIIRVSFSSAAARIDWPGFVGFVILRTVPLFWIPAHTVTFLLPPEYRVLLAAYLSIALGAILAFARIRRPA